MKYSLKNRSRGFGLLEILFVLIIIVLLGAVLYPNLIGGRRDDATGERAPSPQERARQVETVSYLQQINSAISMYRMDHDGRNPQTLEELRPYGVTAEMIVDPVTRQPIPYDPVTGTVGGPTGPVLPRVPGF